MTRAFPPSRYVGGLSFTVISLSDASSVLVTEAMNLTDPDRNRENVHRSRPGVSVHFANAFNIAIACKDEDYALLLNSADYVFSDGVPVTWVGRIAYPNEAKQWERVYGPDVMNMTFASSTEDGPTHYLLGGTPEVLAHLKDAIRVKYPSAQIVGAESPPFREPSTQDLIDRDKRILASGAEMVWVGLGTPKQDYEVARLAVAMPVVALAVGAAFDFIAGTTSQAPVWMQRSGLEWAYRLSREPRRLGRRYIWGNSVFLLEASRTLRGSRRQGRNAPRLK